METTQPLPRARSQSVGLIRLGLPALAGGMLLVSTAFVVLRTAHPTDGTAGAYVTSSWSAAGLAVERLPGGDGVLRSGDRVVSAAGRSLDEWLSGVLSPSLQRPAPGDGLEYGVVRGNVLRDVSVRLAPYPLVDVLLSSWSTVLWLLAMAGVGGYLYWRRPREPAARALLMLGSAVLASSVPWMLGLGPAELVAGGAAPLLYLVATFGIYSLFWSACLHFALVFPGPMASPATQARLVRLAYGLPLAALAAWVGGTLPGSASAVAWVGGWTVAQLALVLALIAVTSGVLVTQWRRAGSTGRGMLRWITAAAVVGIVGVVLGWFLPEALTGSALLPWSAIGLPGLAFPLALGVAVGRHGLFGIETILHRSLVYGGLTAGVVAAYAASVVLLGTILPGEGPYAVTLLATGVAALVALPLRDRLQRSVSRLLYGDRDDPYRAITRLGSRLENSLEPGTVLPMVAQTVAESLRLPYAAIELRHNGDTAVVAAHGAPRGVLERLPLIHQGEEVGWLALAPRAADEPFSAADRALLAELARRAGAAAYAVRLTSDLQRSRQELVSAREEERRRLRRDLHDGVGPSLAGALMKLEAARTLAASDPAAVDRLLSELADQTRRTIEDVRRVAYDLRPPALDQLGLPGALRQDAERLATTGAAYEVSAAEPLPALPAAVEVAAYRIGLEALTNVAHHAGATRAWLDLSVAGDVLLVEVRDNGRGMQATERAGVGLTSMRERADELGGELEIGEAPEGGVSIRARLPLADAPGHG